jgi:alpha-ketoglutaric semialdehyde dehydrogenase
MKLTGSNFIGCERSVKSNVTFQAVNPETGEKMLPLFYEATRQEVDEAVLKAWSAFKAYNQKNGEEKALLLQTIADEIINLGDDLVNRCHEETGLPTERLKGERGRTVNQLRLFADLLKEGSWVEARIDRADPGRQPAPKPDIRSMQKALGPVGIFGAGNFPLAFSVAGGDTASALAAGCPVVVKAHPAHPGTGEMVTTAIHTAIKRTNMPDGTFSMLHGSSLMVGMSVAEHPKIKAIGFTGSFRGGKALFDAAARRPEPIPVYAEMSSTNPVFILPGALSERLTEIAKGLAASVTLGAGQFCTNPGIFIMEESEDSDKFLELLTGLLQETPSSTMLSSAVYHSYKDGITALKRNKEIEMLTRSKSDSRENMGTPYLLKTSAQCFMASKSFEKEVFGPSTLAVLTKNKNEMLDIAEYLSGHLTATLQASGEDLNHYIELISILQQKAGRLIINGFPTGVEVCHSMIHGGPFPATTDCHFTSVGTASIYRFTRPVCYQNFPDHLLPDELKDNNPLQIWRLVDGNRKK